jgi:TfoX/Sxy family transcriptional regulator of competence genes
MASRQTTLDYALDQISGAGEITAKKMFGEYGIYCGGKIVALMCDDQLFIKPTPAGRAFAGAIEEGPPYPGAKPYLLISGDRLEDAEWVSELVRISAAELPPPKPRAPKRRK